MIAVDTNILVYSSDKNTEWHSRAADLIGRLWADDSPWAIPWPCVHEFYSVITNPKIFKAPATPAEASFQIETWMKSRSLILLGEQRGYWPVLANLIASSMIRGAQIHDARIAALCLSNGVKELWTADRDFQRFPALRTRNPLIQR